VLHIAQRTDRSTLDKKTERCILIGITKTSHLLESVTTGKNLKSCHVTFLESSAAEPEVEDNSESETLKGASHEPDETVQQAPSTPE
jgi:hypothetical protein